MKTQRDPRHSFDQVTTCPSFPLERATNRSTLQQPNTQGGAAEVVEHITLHIHTPQPYCFFLSEQCLDKLLHSHFIISNFWFCKNNVVLKNLQVAMVIFALLALCELLSRRCYDEWCKCIHSAAICLYRPTCFCRQENRCQAPSPPLDRAGTARAPSGPANASVAAGGTGALLLSNPVCAVPARKLWLNNP